MQKTGSRYNSKKRKYIQFSRRCSDSSVGASEAVATTDSNSQAVAPVVSAVAMDMSDLTRIWFATQGTDKMKRQQPEAVVCLCFYIIGKMHRIVACDVNDLFRGPRGKR